MRWEGEKGLRFLHAVGRSKECECLPGNIQYSMDRFSCVSVFLVVELAFKSDSLVIHCIIAIALKCGLSNKQAHSEEEIDIDKAL